MTAHKRSPRFAVGDSIKAIGLGAYNGNVGTVEEIIEPKAGDNVYRYRVRFADGSVATFFGFELEINR